MSQRVSYFTHPTWVSERLYESLKLTVLRDWETKSQLKGQTTIGRTCSTNYKDPK